ncbi:fructosamine kinase [Microlunatus endophyticus]|uniref:Fructosamine kinase n=1 Tax=Microlunatus endophyticus TaxID=1716077 RepID=A0A917W8U5_9ACTN|nr:fructosamine kinase family protein [Microlunatus endophyticus]GGL80398.1 fructosamine kinase [Microlunatus endophyticus]
MDGSRTQWPQQELAALLGVEVRRLTPLGGEGFGRPYLAELGDGRTVFAKAQRNAPPGFFDHEAWGLRWLGMVQGGVRTAAVLAAGPGLLVLERIVPERPSRRTAADFGRRLAITHDAGSPGFGREVDSMIASEPLPAGSVATGWPDFYARARLQPFLDRAVAAETIGDHDRHAVEQVIHRLPDLAGPAEPPSRLHGDLWSGNVLWAGGEAVLIDPAAYGGHRETDLAMLALFSLPYLSVVLDGYQQVHPLAAGWQHRVGLHQLFPLLVHTVIFGGGYGAQAGATARSLLGRS